MGEKNTPLGHEDYLTFSGKFVPHPRFEAAMAEVRAAMSLHGADDEVPCVQITGPTGVGKSTLRKKLAREFASRIDGMRIHTPGCPDLIADAVPLLQFDMPPSPNVPRICQQALKVWGDPLWDKGNRENLEKRFDLAAQQHGTMGILIDEAQRLVDRSGTLVKDDIAEWLKDRHKATGCIFILLGLGRLSHLFDKDGQISRRWDAEIRFEPYRWLHANGQSLPDEQADFIGMVASMQAAFPLQFEPGLDLASDSEPVVDRAALRFLYASHGRIGMVVKLLKMALRLRMEQGSRAIVDIALLDRAFERAFRKRDVPMENPFSSAWSSIDRNGVPQLPPPLEDDTLLLNPEPRRVTKRASERALQRALNKS